MKRIDIRLDMEAGEARLTPAMKQKIRDLIEVDSLLAADLLQDALHEMQTLYAEAYNKTWPQIAKDVNHE